MPDPQLTPFSSVPVLDDKRDTDQALVVREQATARMPMSLIEGGGGLDQAEVDARVAAGVQDFAETGNTDPVPDAKIPNTIARTTAIPAKATNPDVDAETDDTKYVTVAKVFRGIARKVKAATKTVAGIIEIASNAEGDAGTDDERAMTPAGVRRQTGAKVSTAEKTARTETGVRRWSPKDVADMSPEKATQAVAEAGTDDDDYMTSLRTKEAIAKHGVDGEQLRINEFIDSRGVVSIERTVVAAGPNAGQALLTTGTGPLNGKTILAVSKDNDAALLGSLETGDQFLLVVTANGNSLFGTLSQDPQDSGEDTDKNLIYDIDADRGVDTQDNVGAGAAKIYFRRAALARNLSNAEAPAEADSDTAPSALLVWAASAAKRWSWANFFTRIKKALVGDRGFVSDVQSDSDPYTFAADYTFLGTDPAATPVNANSRWNLNGVPILDGVAKGIVIQFAPADETAAVARWLAKNEFVFGAARFKITGSVNKIADRKYQATVQLVEGAAPAANDTATPILEPDSPHRKEFTTASFREKVGLLAHYYLRTTGAGKDVVVEAPLTARPADAEERKKMMTAGTVADEIDKASPQLAQAQNTASTAVTGDYVVFATTDALTPRSADSDFIVTVMGITGSIAISNLGAQGDLQVERKIGSGAWTAVDALGKSYVFFATGAGNYPFSAGQRKDRPNTADPVRYRAALKRATSGNHNGTWNCESLTLTVQEML